MSDLAVGDVIQCSGETVPADLRDKFFVVRSLGPPITLSWPYIDQSCTRLYVPRLSEFETERDWRYRCEALERREKKANKALGLILKSRDVLHSARP